MTDAGEKTGRELLSYFETIRAVFHQAGIADSPLPVRVFAFAAESEFHSYSDEKNSAGFYHGSDRDTIALYAGPDAGRVALHEYVHSVLNHSKIPLPKWFEEGTAEFYSNLRIERTANSSVVRDQEKDERTANSNPVRVGQVGLRVGDPIAVHLAVLRSEPLLSAEHLASMKTEPLYYAESWALVHMLNLAPAWRDGMPRYILSLADGRDAGDAFQLAFGKTLDQALSSLPAYLPFIRAVSLSTDVEQATEAPRVPRVDRMTPLEAAVARMDLAMQVHRPALARSLVSSAVRGKQETPEVLAAMGSLALAEGRSADAQTHFERAIELGSRDPETWFQYAMLERERGTSVSRPVAASTSRRGTASTSARGDTAPESQPDGVAAKFQHDRRVDELLEKVIAIDANFAEAQFLLGTHLTDQANYAAAIEHLREAVRVRPHESNYWYALGFAQSKAGQREGALESARHAKAVATNDRDEHMAESLAALAREPASTHVQPAQKGPDVMTPSSWQDPKGDARVEGVLTRVDCDGDSARLEVTDAAGKMFALFVRHPGQVRLVNARDVEHTFSCGPQSIQVAIEFVQTSAEVTRIEFR
jgi:Flp pilus assembly protein TadD